MKASAKMHAKDMTVYTVCALPVANDGLVASSNLSRRGVSDRPSTGRARAATYVGQNMATRIIVTSEKVRVGVTKVVTAGGLPGDSCLSVESAVLAAHASGLGTH
jgi:hypothetical protein